MQILDYNIAAPKGAVPVSGGYSIKGHKGGKGGGGSTRTPVEDEDNLHSIAYASIIDLISAGPIHGFANADNPLRSVYLDNTPIENEDGSLNFQDVQMEFRAGTQDQHYIPGFPAVETSSGVSVELRSDQPFTRSIQNIHISAVRVGLSVRGLKRQSATTGDISGYRIEYAIELSTDNSAFTEVLRAAFDGKTTQQYARSHRIDLPRAQTGWTVRVRRITENSRNSTVSDVTFVDSITEVTDAKLRRPMSACVGLRVNAKQFQSIPSRAFDLYLRVVRVPSNYDAWTHTYTGTWDGTFKMSWTNNPAWVFYDLATNACDGLGHLLPASWLDKWALYQIAQYCDEQVPDGKGGTEPRFSCNVYLQDKAEAWRVLQDLASVFRGIAYYAQGSVLAVADMPRDAVYTYSNANVIDGLFQYSGSSLTTRHTVALVSWNDETDMGRAKVEVLEDPDGIARYGVRQLELTAFGCTSQGQAQRIGRSALFTSRMETETVTFAVGLTGTLAQPGQVIEIADSHLAGRRIGGLTRSATNAVVTLDAPVRVSVGDRLTVVLPDGVSQSRPIIVQAGQTQEAQTLQVDPPFSQTPEAEAAWSINSTELATQKYRVLSVAEDGDLQYTIHAVQYVEGKHAAIDYETRVEVPPLSVTPPPVQGIPANVLINSYHVIDQGHARHNAVVSWDSVPNAVAYEVQWRRDHSEWIVVPRTGSTSIEIPNVYAGNYIARVRAINVLDVSSLWGISALTELNGKLAAPLPVKTLRTASMPWGIRVQWSFPSDPNIIERTEIRYSPTQDFEKAVKAGEFAYPTDSFDQTGLALTTRHFFWARLIDKNGTPGPWFPEEDQPGVLGEPVSRAGDYNELITPSIVEGGLGELLMGNIRDIPKIRDSVGDLTLELGELNQRVDEVNGQVQELLLADKWDSKKAYAAGAVVFANDKMYRAKKAVPAGKKITDAAYWGLIGDFASITDGLAALAVQSQETISRVESAEGQIQANAQQINTVAGQVNDPATGLGALASSVQSMRTQVEQLEGGLRSLSDSITALSSKVDGLDAAQRGLATAVNSLGTRVTATEGKLDAQASSIMQLTTSVNSADAKAVAAQDAAAAAATAAGAKGEVIFATAAPAAAKRLAQNLWIDTKNNANTPKRWNGSAWVAVTDKAATDAAAAAVAAKAAADAAQATANQKADASAVQALSNRVTATEQGVSAQAQSITKLETGLESLTAPAGNLLLASNVEQVRATPVYLFGRYNLTEDFVPAQGYTLVVCYTHKPAEGDTESRIGVWAGGSSNRVADLERNVEQSVQVVKFTKAAANALPRELRFYYAPSPGNHAGQATIHWAALYLGDVVPAMQWQPNLAEVVEEISANSSAIKGLTSTVTQQGSSISSQGRDLTALQNTVNDPKTGLAATAGALNETNSRVTSVEGQQDALANSQLVLNAEIKRQQAGEDADLERVLNQFDTQKEQTQIRASLAEFKNVQADENRALAESITTLETGIGINSAAVEQVARSLTELDGKIASSWGVKLQANQSGVKYVSGVGLDLTNESGVMQSTFAVLADRFAVMHAANGNPTSVFSVQGGASILNTALIGNASIGTAKIADAAITTAKIVDAQITEAKLANASITSAKIGTATIDTLNLKPGAITKLGSHYTEGYSRGETTFPSYRLTNAVPGLIALKLKFQYTYNYNYYNSEPVYFKFKIFVGSLVIEHIVPGGMEWGSTYTYDFGGLSGWVDLGLIDPYAKVNVTVYSSRVSFGTPSSKSQLVGGPFSLTLDYLLIQR
ncbi:TipJ family phage tail tip protein [Alcaligenes phenolicus]|uniref:Phage tail protein n=1 Tax=Alcaligenes phenolicus TaxID=232846 RepID=A0AAW5W241_9BURK|nr:phage tail protein [Alcaligenes phenolicus]MCX5567181.1 phage tail protein [Alcaligenes phenolicus]